MEGKSIIHTEPEQASSPKEELGELLDDILVELLTLQQTQEAKANPELLRKLKQLASDISKAQTIQENL